MFNRLTRKKKILLAFLPILFLTGVVVAQTFFTGTRVQNYTFNVGVGYAAAQVMVQFDSGTVTPCTQSNSTDWSCPNVLPSKMFTGDSVTFYLQIESDKAGQTYNLANNWPGTVATQYCTLSSGFGSTCTGGNLAGLPTSVAGTFYGILATFTVTSSQSGTGSLTWNLQHT